MKIIVLALCCILTAAVTQRRLTDAEQQQAIDKLNEVRRRVANGEAINKDGNKLPPAADMQQLVSAGDCAYDGSYLLERRYHI
uniref:Uncharacterized protein n=1 Tax=Bursaphelenchus xylophilus TaxID=6326 RepID=A0A1I7SN10_BURXY